MSWRNILITLAILIASAGLCFTLFANTDSDMEVCKELIISIKPSERSFITEKEIINCLNINNLNPKSKLNKEVKLNKIREKLEQLAVVKTAKCYFAKNGNLKIEIIQRQPFYKIVGNSSYCVDTERNIITTSSVLPIYVPIVSGTLTKSFATTELFDFVKFVEKDGFLSKLIAQIYITQKQEIELVPTIGNQIIKIGRIKKIDGKYDFEVKLGRLKTFYTKNVLNKMGWETYSTIDLRFDKQVVCKRANGQTSL
jgi:cell division protein FtsQ